MYFPVFLIKRLCIIFREKPECSQSDFSKIQPISDMSYNEKRGMNDGYQRQTNQQYNMQPQQQQQQMNQPTNQHLMQQQQILMHLQHQQPQQQQQQQQQQIMNHPRDHWSSEEIQLLFKGLAE
jgi:hypothetical protein